MKKNSLLADILIYCVAAFIGILSGMATFLGDSKTYSYKPKKPHHF